MTKYEKQATRFAAAVNKLVGGEFAKVWNAGKCADKGYGAAKAGVVLEETGVGACNDTSVVLEHGYGREYALPSMARVPGVFAEPYASWLLLFYEE